MAINEDIQAVAQAGGSEIAQATLLQKVSLGALACSLAFEWGTGNEALMGIVGGNVLQATHNALVTAIATGGASFTEQAVFGLVATMAVANFPRTTAAIRNRFFPPRVEDENRVVPEHPGRQGRLAALFGRFTTAFALGTAVPTIARSAVEERSVETNTREVLTDAALIGLGVAAIAGTASGVTNAGEALGMQQQAQVLVDVIKSPFTYMSLFGFKVASDWVKSRFRRTSREEIHMTNESIQIGHAQGLELYRSSDNSLRVVASNVLNESDRETVWNMMQQGFQGLNEKAGAKQDMTREEFDADVESADVYHYVAYDGEDRPVGFLNVHWGLDSVRWAPDAVRERMMAAQESVNPDAEPAYVGTLVVPEALRAGEVAPALVRACYTHWQQKIAEQGDTLCFFDCAQANYPRLPHLLQFLARPSKEGFKGIPLNIDELAIVPEGADEVLEPGAYGPFPNNIQRYFAMHIS